MLTTSTEYLVDVRMVIKQVIMIALRPGSMLIPSEFNVKSHSTKIDYLTFSTFKQH
jgi:hypothetical protein